MVNLFASASLLSFPSHRSTRSTSLISHLTPVVINCKQIYTILFLFCGTFSRQIYVTLLIMSLLCLYLNQLSLIFQPLSFTLPFLLI